MKLLRWLDFLIKKTLVVIHQDMFNNDFNATNTKYSVSC